MKRITLRLQDETGKRVEAYAAHVGAPTLNAALCALIAQGLDADDSDRERAAITRAPRQRGASK
jgi:hypothetical protein